MVFPKSYCELLTSIHQVAELLMCALSHNIREKSNWWEEMKDEVIVEKWREEALQHEVEYSAILSRKPTPAMVKGCYFRTPLPGPYLDI